MVLLGEYGKCTLEDLKQGLTYLGIHTGFGNEWLKIGGAKIFSDGAPPEKSSWMYEEYPGGGFGGLVIPGKTDEERYNELINMIVYAHECGFQLGIHSNGDRAIDAVVDGYIKAMDGKPNHLRHHVIHGDFTTDACAGRMGKYGIGVIAQPGIKAVASDLMDRVMGEERSQRHWPCRLFLDSGIPLAISSDAPIIYPDWRYSVQSAVLRESKATGKVSGPEQCITVEEAIRAHTMGGAWIDHTDHIKGSIEVGKLADFCVLGEDILKVESHEISSIPVLKTIIGGYIVHDAG
jgi:predicted amidohydrolase YtcJ